MKFIAELCQNHNGDVKVLHQMVDDATEAGATHIKIQHIQTRNLTFRPEFETGFVVEKQVKTIKRPWAAELKRLKSLELSDNDYRLFVEHVNANGLVPMTTCFARGDIKMIRDEGFKEIKIASYDCSSYQLIREVIGVFDYIYVSTGATYDDELAKTVEILSSSNKAHALLHCVTEYPTMPRSMNLSRIHLLKSMANTVGYSDHSSRHLPECIASKVAIYLGAEVIERHFTILPEEDTKDGPVSVTKDNLKNLVEFSRKTKEDQLEDIKQAMPDWEIMKGISSRGMSHEEKLNRAYYRGRFGTPRCSNATMTTDMIMNWEENSIDYRF